MATEAAMTGQQHDGHQAGLRVDWSGSAGDVLVLRLDHAPVNALDRPLRAALIAALDQHASKARAVILIGEGRNFSAATGLDHLPPAGPAVVALDGGSPTLAEVALRLEATPVPVIAVLDGLVLAGGAELALAAHARVAMPGMRFALPGITLGLPPEAGASQRLPRLVGATEALTMLLQARMVGSEEAVAIGLVDLLTEEEPLQAAVALLAKMPGPRPTADRRDGLSDVAGYAAALRAARAAAGRGPLAAPSRIIDCVEAALYLPFENGLALEAVAHADLAASPEAAGLIAAARGERRLTQIPARFARHRPPPLATIGIVGAEASQAALVFMALGRGLRVLWHDPDRDRLAAGRAWVEGRQEDEHRAGRLSLAQRDADRARMHGIGASPDLAGAGALILGSRDSWDTAELGRMARSHPTVPQIFVGGALGHLGLAIAPSIRIAELSLPKSVEERQVPVAVQLLRRLGMAVVLVGDSPLIGRRVAAAGRMALGQLLALGVPRRVLAAALDDFGHAMPELPDPAEPAMMRAMTEEEVRRRWLGAMANEGLRLLDAGVALRPSDIDQLMIAGHGFPRWRGGPMHQAATRGLMVLRSDMWRWQEEGALWQPQPMMDRLIAEGRRLEHLDAE